MNQTNRRNRTEAFVIETVEDVKSQILDTLKTEVNKSIDLLKSKIIDNLIKDNKDFQRNLSCLRKKLNIFKTRVYDIEVGLLYQQQGSRRNN